MRTVKNKSSKAKIGCDACNEHSPVAKGLDTEGRILGWIKLTYDK